MKIHFTILIFLWVVPSDNVLSQSNISGIIHGFTGKPIVVNQTHQGEYFQANNTEIIVKGEKFNINIKSDHPELVTLSYQGKNYRMFYTPGQQTKISIIDGIATFSGDHASENSLLMSLERKEEQYPRFTNKILSLEPDSAFAVWKRKLTADLDSIKRYCSEKTCDPLLVQTIIDDQVYYYINSFTFGLIIKVAPRAFSQRSRAEMDSLQLISVKTFLTKWGNVWTKIVETGNKTKPTLFSNEFLDFLSVYYGWYLGYYIDPNDANTYADHSATFKIASYRIKDLLPSIEEVYLANRLFTGWSFGLVSYSLESINLYKKFVEKYPASYYLTYLKPIAKEVSSYLKIDESNFNDKYFYETEKFQTLESLLSQFKGKVIYIDLWATWCGPCIEQFKFKASLDSFIRNKPIVLLYVSLDFQREKALWKKIISKLDIKGDHFLASEAFKIDLWNQLSSIGTKGAIPRYLIVGKNGKIQNLNAPRPGDRNQLYQQLELLL